jgi:hypothetical protein
VAEEVLEHGGTAGVWLARPAAVAQERALATAMSAARATEYLLLAEAADVARAAPERPTRRVLARLRRQWRDITRRDFFPPPERDLAAAALRALTDGAVDVVGAAPGRGSR